MSGDLGPWIIACIHNIENDTHQLILHTYAFAEAPIRNLFGPDQWKTTCFIGPFPSKSHAQDFRRIWSAQTTYKGPTATAKDWIDTANRLRKQDKLQMWITKQEKSVVHLSTTCMDTQYIESIRQMQKLRKK
jgi:hypothetical protein